MPFHGILYGLYHPLTDELRYLGKTSQRLAKRFSSHLNPSPGSRQTHVYRWICALKREGLVPVCRELGTANSESALNTLEMWAITEAHKLGIRLTNLTEGGEGTSGWHHTAIAKQLIAQATSGPRPASQGRKHTQWRDDIDTETILKRIREGAKRQDIAKELGISPTFLGRRLNVHRRTHGDHVARDPLYNNRKQKPPLDLAHVAEQLQGGMNVKTIAATLGMDEHTLHRRLNKNPELREYTRRPEHYARWRDLNVPAIIARLKTGISLDVVAAEFGVIRQTIAARLKEASPEDLTAIKAARAARPGHAPAHTKETGAKHCRWRHDIVEADIAARIAAGENQKDIAAEFGVARQTLYNRLKAYYATQTPPPK